MAASTGYTSSLWIVVAKFTSDSSESKVRYSSAQMLLRFSFPVVDRCLTSDSTTTLSTVVVKAVFVLSDEGFKCFCVLCENIITVHWGF